MIIRLVAIGVLGTVVCIAGAPDPNKGATSQQQRLSAIPLSDHMLKPPGEWMTSYGDQPVDKVTYTWNFAALIARVNRQTQEIETLKADLGKLKKFLDPNDVIFGKKELP